LRIAVVEMWIFYERGEFWLNFEKSFYILLGLNVAVDPASKVVADLTAMRSGLRESLKAGGLKLVGQPSILYGPHDLTGGKWVIWLKFQS